MLATLLSIYIRVGVAAESVRNVLVLNSYHQELPWTRGFTEGLRKASKETPIEWHLYFENMDVTRIETFDESMYLSYLSSKYAGHIIDGIIADSEPAAEFVKRNHSELTAPVRIYYSDAPNPGSSGYVIGTRLSRYAEKTLGMAISQNPGRDQIVLIESGTPALENKEMLLRSELESYPNIKLSVRSNFYLDEFLDEATQYGDDTIILYNLVFSDKSGTTYVPREVVKKIAEVSPVPVYAFYSTFLGTGIVGGHLNDANTAGRSSLIAMADFFRTGKFSKTYPVTKTTIDATAAKRFGIKLSGLGPDTLIINQPDSWLAQNFQFILWGFIAAILLTLFGFVWATKLRAVNRQLSRLNEFLQDSQQELEVTNYNLKKQSMIDPLTGLLNRRAMLPKLKEAIYECSRYQTASLLMLLDLDDFKVINDQHGHNCGDRVLERVSETLNQETRVSDSLARWGGEEFLILAKATALSEAGPFAENIRAKIESLDFGSEFTVTISIGICLVRPDLSVDRLLEKADEAMYRAKHEGKNRSVIAE